MHIVTVRLLCLNHLRAVLDTVEKKVLVTVSLYPVIVQCVFPKKRDSHSYNNGTMIMRKLNIDMIPLSNLQGFIQILPMVATLSFTVISPLVQNLIQDVAFHFHDSYSPLIWNVSLTFVSHDIVLKSIGHLYF